MDTSVRWLNDYLDPPASAEQQAELATRAGFPLESSEEAAVSDGKDTRQDFEMTSNRGDCVCHLGLAREIAALSGRTLKIPQTKLQSTGPAASSIVSVTNHEPDLCPLYTARVIRGVKVGQSPAWLRDRLIARGDIPRNNIVDASNFVLFEFGQPTHVFDLAQLHGPQIIIRMAKAGEPFLPIGEGAQEVKLQTSDLVIADADRAVALAGVKGGALTAVTNNTTDILIEAATFAPTTVRATSRRLNITSDSAYRFERGVHPGTIEPAADRLTALLLELCGGELCEGVVSDGKPIPAPITVEMRINRCRQLLGVPISEDRMIDALTRLGFQPQRKQDVIVCTVPMHRLDVDREVDLIEEVGRMFGLDNIPIKESIELRVKPPQAAELAKRAVFDELVGMGFIETTTHSLISEQAAEMFLAGGESLLKVEDDRAKADPILRPSVLPSLLRVRAHNADQGVHELKLFESASTFRRSNNGHSETVCIGLLADIEDKQLGIRPMRGIIERLINLLTGPTDVHLEAADEVGWLQPGAHVTCGGKRYGSVGIIPASITRRFGLDQPVMAAELQLHPLYSSFPPEAAVHGMPAFPAIERDISAILDDAVTWETVQREVEQLSVDHLEATEFITTFRGKGIPSGCKSLTLRLRFRSERETLRHEQVDPQVDAVRHMLTTTLNAEIRS